METFSNFLTSWAPFRLLLGMIELIRLSIINPTPNSVHKSRFKQTQAIVKTKGQTRSAWIQPETLFEAFVLHNLQRNVAGRHTTVLAKHWNAKPIYNGHEIQTYLSAKKHCMVRITVRISQWDGHGLWPFRHLLQNPFHKSRILLRFQSQVCLPLPQSLVSLSDMRRKFSWRRSSFSGMWWSFVFNLIQFICLWADTKSIVW